MIRCKSEATARAFASERACMYGWSVFPPTGVWYVGTREELAKAGVVDPLEPNARKAATE